MSFYPALGDWCQSSTLKRLIGRLEPVGSNQRVTDISKYLFGAGGSYGAATTLGWRGVLWQSGPG